MGKYGINVPKGVAVSSVEEVRKAIRDVFPNESEVTVCNSRHYCVHLFQTFFSVDVKTEEMNGKYHFASYVYIICFRKKKKNEIMQRSCIWPKSGLCVVGI